MKTVDELVSAWTPEERKRFKDLIDECRERERSLMETSRASQESLQRLKGLEISLLVKSAELKKTLEGFADSLFRIYFRLHDDKLSFS